MADAAIAKFIAAAVAHQAEIRRVVDVAASAGIDDFAVAPGSTTSNLAVTIAANRFAPAEPSLVGTDVVVHALPPATPSGLHDALVAIASGLATGEGFALTEGASAPFRRVV